MLSHVVLFVPPKLSAYDGQKSEGAKEFTTARGSVELTT